MLTIDAGIKKDELLWDCILKTKRGVGFLINRNKKSNHGKHDCFLWALTDSNRRPSACKADALNQLS